MSAGLSDDNTLKQASSKSAENSVDKKELFAKLLRVQYPLSQESAVTSNESFEDSRNGYQREMDALIEKYAGSY